MTLISSSNSDAFLWCRTHTALVGQEQKSSAGQGRFATSATTQTAAWLREKIEEEVEPFSEAADIKPAKYRIFEKGDKIYLDEKERKSWSFRVAMIEAALATAQLFSISIIPADSSEKQSWYHKKPVPYQNPNGYSKELERLIGDRSLVVNSLFQVSYLSSDQAESPDFPAPHLGGFFAPFPRFSSPLARPQYDPSNLADSVISANVFTEKEMESVIEGLENDSIRRSICHIVEAFIGDVHSIGLGLVVLEPRHQQIKTLFFRKIFS